MSAYLLSLSRKYLKHYAGLSYEAWLGIMVYLVESSFMGVFYFLSVYFVNELHLTIATAGTIVSFWGLGAMAGGVIGGKLADNISPLLITICSLFLQACAYLILLYIRHFHYLAMDMLLLGVTSYSFITACQLWVLSQCQHEVQKIKALNLLATASNFGLAASAVLVSYFAMYGFKTIFIATGVGLMLLASCLCNFKGVSVQRASMVNVEGALRERHNWLVLGCVFFIGMIVSQLGSTYAIYIQYRFPSLGIQAVSILFFLNSLLVVVFGTPIGNYFNHYNKMKLVGVGGFLIGFSMFMLVLYPSFSFAMLACAVYTIGEILFFCMAQYVCYRSGSENQKGHSLGLFRMVYAGSRIVGPLLGGIIYQQAGADGLWCACGLAGVICLVCCFSFGRLSPTNRSVLVEQ